MSLAQELLDDLDSLGSQYTSDDETNIDAGEDAKNTLNEDGENDIENVEERKLSRIGLGIDKPVDERDEKKKGSIYSLAKLLRAKNTVDTLKKIDNLSSKSASEPRQMIGIVEEDPEYRLIVDSNLLVADIDNEMVLVIKFIRDKYEARFKGLDNLITNPLDYVRAVKTIGDIQDLTKLDLKSFLPSATAMILTVVNTELPKSTLSKEGLNEVMEACDMAMELDTVQRKLISFVESRMSYIAPNLSAIIGTTTAARLLGAAGGLVALSKIPACNLQTLGSAKAISAGLSKASVKNHMGFIYQADIIASAPSDLRTKVARIVSNKVALAARVDRSQTSQDGSTGRAFRQDIDKKLELLIQPPPSKQIKALPVPDEGPKKRRGGRRVRAMKDSLAVTELRKAQNRVNFGEAEDEAHGMDSMMGLGTMTSNRGQVRAAAIDTRTKLSVSKRHKTMLAKASTTPSGTVTSGFSTSLAFTPAQGIELENPEARSQRAKQANDKYFGNSQSFKNLKK